MSRVERTLSLPRSISPRSPRLSSPLACHTTSLHAGKGFIEIYSCLRLHVHTYPHVYERVYERQRVYRTYVCAQVCVCTCAWSCALSEVESRVPSDRALTRRRQPSQVYTHVSLYYQSTHGAYKLIRAVGRRRHESSRKFSPRSLGRARRDQTDSATCRRVKRQAYTRPYSSRELIER